MCFAAKPLGTCGEGEHRGVRMGPWQHFLANTGAQSTCSGPMSAREQGTGRRLMTGSLALPVQVKGGTRWKGRNGFMRRGHAGPPSLLHPHTPSGWYKGMYSRGRKGGWEGLRTLTCGSCSLLNVDLIRVLLSGGGAAPTWGGSQKWRQS